MDFGPPNASVNHARLIRKNVEVFNATPTTDNFGTGNFRLKTFRYLFNLTILESIIIFGFSAYTPRDRFPGGDDGDRWYARIKSEGDEHFISIEERSDGYWIQQERIPFKNIQSIRTELHPTDPTRFNLFLTISEIEKIRRDRSIRERTISHN